MHATVDATSVQTDQMQATVDVISVMHAVLLKAQMQHLSLSSCDIMRFQLLVVQMCP